MTISRILIKLTLSISALLFILSLSIPVISRAAEAVVPFISEIDLAKLAEASRFQQTIHLSVNGRDYELRLQPSSAVAAIQTENQFFYEGKVAQDENSWVRLSYHDGQISGHFKAWGELFEITQSGTGSKPEYGLKTIEKTELHMRGYGKDLVLTPPPTADRTYNPFMESLDHFLVHKASASKTPVTRVLKLAIVVDSRFNEIYNGKGLEKALSIVNSVDGLYRDQFGLAVQLQSSLLLTKDNDPFLEFDGSIETILREFRAYTLSNNDSANNTGVLHLFSGSYDANNIIGLSWIDTTCRTDGYNVSVSTPFSRQMLLAAHEIGHNLGAVHDDNHSCNVEYNKVMWPNISDTTSSDFSDCSKETIIPKLSASCNLDNIDMSLSIKGSAETTSENKHSLEILAHNASQSKVARKVQSATLFPDGVVPSSIPSRCNYFADTLTCNHGNIQAGSSNSVKVSVEGLTESVQSINGELILTEFADINTLNNFASFSSAEDNETIAATETSTFNDTSSGGGFTSYQLIAVLLFILLLQALRFKSTHVFTHPKRNSIRDFA